VTGILQLRVWGCKSTCASRLIGSVGEAPASACVRNLEATQSKIKPAKKFGVGHYALHKGPTAHLWHKR
jgi:hypothetical protein